MVDLIIREEPMDKDRNETGYISLDDRLADAKRRSDETDDGTGGSSEHEPLTKGIEI